MKSVIQEFKEFAMRGNVMDLAIGIIIGGAFGGIVSSLVNDIIMPTVGLLVGGVDFSNLVITLKPEVTLNYGIFINTILDFVIIAFAIFIVVKAMNKLKRKEEKKAKGPTEIELLTEIRDALKK